MMQKLRDLARDLGEQTFTIYIQTRFLTGFDAQIIRCSYMVFQKVSSTSHFSQNLTDEKRCDIVRHYYCVSIYFF